MVKTPIVVQSVPCELESFDMRPNVSSPQANYSLLVIMANYLLLVIMANYSLLVIICRTTLALNSPPKKGS